MNKIILLICICSLAMLVGCTNTTNPPQIALMELSTSQQEILDLITHSGQEFVFFEYTNKAATKIEIWVEVYQYGELLGQYSNFTMFCETPMEAAPIVISIHHPNRNEFQWSISSGGGISLGVPWVTQREYVGRMFDSIRTPVEIIDGQEMILYLSKFTTGTTFRTMNDLQHYLVYPENLAGYTYVHIIKARFTK